MEEKELIEVMADGGKKLKAARKQAAQEMRQQKYGYECVPKVD